MANLDYSDDAINVLSKFYRVDTLVYVEGQDDIPFWEYLFDKFSSLTVEIKDVGGSPEIGNYIEKITNGDIFAVVACDADFSYVEEFPIHPNVIRTYGYSIENTLLCEQSIKKVLKTIGRIPNQSIEAADIGKWIEEIYSSTNNIVIHDIANHLLDSGKVVVGDNCSRFTNSRNSHRLCVKKIEDHLAGLRLPLDRALEKRILDALDKNSREVSDVLRGHFFFSAALKYIVKVIAKARKKISLSNDAFFGALILAFEAVFNNDHPHFKYYSDCVGNAQTFA